MVTARVICAGREAFDKHVARVKKCEVCKCKLVPSNTVWAHLTVSTGSEKMTTFCGECQVIADKYVKDKSKENGVESDYRIIFDGRTIE